MDLCALSSCKDDERHHQSYRDHTSNDNQDHRHYLLEGGLWPLNTNIQRESPIARYVRGRHQDSRLSMLARRAADPSSRGIDRQTYRQTDGSVDSRPVSVHAGPLEWSADNRFDQQRRRVHEWSWYFVHWYGQVDGGSFSLNVEEWKKKPTLLGLHI